MADNRSRVGGWAPNSGGTHIDASVVEPEVATGPFDVSDDDWSEPPASAGSATATSDRAYHGRRRLAGATRRVLTRPWVGLLALAMGILLVGAGALVRSLQPSPDPVVAPPPTPAVNSPVDDLDRQGQSPSAPPSETSTPSPSATPSARTDSFQAEAAELGDRAQVVALAGASGDEAVKINGRGGTFVRFGGVTADEAGRYELAISYFCDQDRESLVSVNDGSPAEVAFAAPGEGDIGVVSLTVELAAGANTVTVGTEGGAPLFVDEIAVTG